MKRVLVAVPVLLCLFFAGIAFAGDWYLVKNVKRLERVSPDYQEDKAIDKKFLDVLDLTEKTRKDDEVYEEAKKIAGMTSLAPSKYMDSFLYYLFVRSASLSRNRPAEPDYWLGLLKAYDKSPHLLAAYLVRMKQLPKNSPEARNYAQVAVEWVKAQKPDLKVRAPEYTGNMLLGYKPRTVFAEGDSLKLYKLSYYKETVTPAAGFQDDDTYVSLLGKIKDGREDILAEMAAIYKKMGKRKEASDILYQHAMLKGTAKDFAQAKVLLDEAVRYDPDNVEAKKMRDRVKLELTYQSLAPAPAAPVAVQQQDVSSVPTVSQ